MAYSTHLQLPATLLTEEASCRGDKHKASLLCSTGQRSATPQGSVRWQQHCAYVRYRLRVHSRTSARWIRLKLHFNPLNAKLNPICHLLVLLGDLTFMCPCIVSIFQYISTRCNVTQFIYIWKLLYMFRVVLPPFIRRAHNCIYSIWYLSHRYCYLPLSWKSWKRFKCAVGGVRHPQHTQTADWQCYSPSRSSQTLLRPSLLSKFHTVSR
jgi:hypothetical protein